MEEPEKTIILIRHGIVLEDWIDRFAGSTDIALSEKGRLQADRLAQRLSRAFDGYGPLRCLSSPMMRTRDTAGPLIGESGLDLEIDENLREIDFGLWEGLTFEEILSKQPDVLGQWLEGDTGFRFPQGEYIKAFQKRIRLAGEAIAGVQARNVLVFTHGGVIRFLLCHYLGLDLKNSFSFDVKHASITTIRLFGERCVLTGLNDTHHLEGC